MGAVFGPARSLFHRLLSRIPTRESSTGVGKPIWGKCTQLTGYLVWLAPTSLWSFTARLSLMMAEKLNIQSPYTIPNMLDQEIYPLHWRHAVPDEPLDISGLPSIDHAHYLFNTVKFHLDQAYRFFDQDVFLSHIHEFYYGNALEKANESRLWFVQFLLVLAFGNAFLLQSRNSKDPPGSKFFVRAMALMPDHASIWKNGLMAIEVLALAGLYLYCIDQRESAHVYVGHSLLKSIFLSDEYAGRTGYTNSATRWIAHRATRR